jgi:hypothetical protein
MTITRKSPVKTPHKALVATTPESGTSTFPATEEVELWNEEDAEELERSPDLSAYNILISARDWTVETIVQQIKQGNIDLDPAFQRRNAWRDQRRSRLMESFILGFPVPQIVLAENLNRKKTFVVIDGKQRLMTIAGFFLEDFREYWTQPRFSGLSVLEDLNKVTIDNFLTSAVYGNARRQLANADIRTTVLTGFSDEGVLYDIFYRINTGSVPLSSQELRQVLNRGPFAKYILEVTSEPNPLWEALRISAPDPRLRDVELLLRLVAWRTFSSAYTGNMKPFLDATMKSLNASWDKDESKITLLVSQLLQGVETGIDLLGADMGRKFKAGHFEQALNRALFEVQAFYFSFPAVREAARRKKRAFLAAFKALSANSAFLQSIESTTKSIENYRLRFETYRTMLKAAIGVQAESLALGHSK